MVSLLLSILTIALSTLVGLIFLTAAMAKLRDMVRFEGVVANYRLLPSPLVRPVARLLPGLELGLALLLPTGWGGVAASTAAALLLVLFAGAMAINIRRGRRRIDCGCGDQRPGAMLGWGQVARNLALGLPLPILAAAGTTTPDWTILMLGWGTGLLLFLLDRVAAAFADLNTRAGQHPARRRRTRSFAT